MKHLLLATGLLALVLSGCGDEPADLNLQRFGAAPPAPFVAQAESSSLPAAAPISGGAQRVGCLPQDYMCLCQLQSAHAASCGINVGFNDACLGHNWLEGIQHFCDASEADSRQCWERFASYTADCIAAGCACFDPELASTVGNDE